MKVSDLSNYDDDQDIHDPDGWVPALKAAGIQGVILGSQDMSKARWQAQKLREGNLPVIATYAEPNVGTAIELAQETGARIVALVIEPGGIQDINTLRVGIASVKAANLTPKLYGNRGDILALVTAAEFGDIELWFAAYYNDHHVVTSVDFWPKLWGHQYTSTLFIDGKNRDVSEIFEEPDMPDARVDDLIKAVFGSPERMAGLIANNKALEARVSFLEGPDGPIAMLEHHEMDHEEAGDVPDHVHQPAPVLRKP